MALRNRELHARNDDIHLDKSTKIVRYMCIQIANKFAKFHTKRPNGGENIPKSFRGLLF